MVRRAGESALMLFAAVQTPGFLSSRSGAFADVVLVGYEARIATFDVPADAFGSIIADFAVAHALALVRLAELQSVPIAEAAARLASLVKEG
jgi:hypothetical protein